MAKRRKQRTLTTRDRVAFNERLKMVWESLRTLEEAVGHLQAVVLQKQIPDMTPGRMEALVHEEELAEVVE